MDCDPRRCLLLFSRAPAAEARLKGIAAATPVFEATVRRTAALARTLDRVDLVVVGLAGATGPLAARHLEQRGADFAERLLNAFGDVRALGYDAIVVVPGDVPGLGHLGEAFRQLEAGRTVLGPCHDGGVYLIGARGPVAGLLGGVRWRTGAVLADLRVRAPEAVLLAPLGDVDRSADLARLARGADLDEVLQALIRSLRTTAPRGRRPDRVPVPSAGRSVTTPRGPPCAAP